MPIQEYIFDYIHQHIPDNLYDAGSTFLEHFMIVYYALHDGFTYLLRSRNEGDAPAAASHQLFQAILPPIMSVIAIYFGLLSLYRTTTSFFRTTAFLIKWGSLLGLLAMGAGFLAGRTPLNIGTVVQTAANIFSNNNNNERTQRNGGYRSAAGSRGSTARRRDAQDRPGVFDSFLKQEEWRKAQESTEDTQAYVAKVVKAGQKVFNDGSGFLNLIFGRAAGGDDADEIDADGPARRTRSQSKRRGRR